MTLEEFHRLMSQFTSYLRDTKNYSSHTIRAYIADLEQYAKFWNLLQERSERAIDFSYAVERYFSLMGTKKNNTSTIARKISSLNTLERFAQHNGFQLNMTVNRPYIHEKVPTYLSEKEIDHILTKTPQQALPTKRPLRDQAIIELLYSTGIKCSEIIALRCSDMRRIIFCIPQIGGKLAH